MSTVTAGAKGVTVDQVIAAWQEQGIETVRFEIPDMHGTSLSKLVPIEHAAAYSRDGLNMYGGAGVLDSHADVVPGTLYNEEKAYADQRLFPDADTAAVVPWADSTARFICDSRWRDGVPLRASPRHVFRSVLDRCHEMGFDSLIGIEYEFYLLDAATQAPLFNGYHIFNTTRNTWVPLIERIVAAMRRYGVDIITANCEYAGSQWEINFRPGRGMAGPDLAFSFKNGVKELARRDGLLATFMSKPFADSAGSGAHTHMSLLDRDSGRTVMADPSAPDGLSLIARQFIAGQLRHAGAAYALLAPTLNCLKRRRSHTFSPTNISWAVEDRSALIRVTGATPERVHIENRAPSAMSNPYLASAVLLASGLLGIRDSLTLESAAAAPAEEDGSRQKLPSRLEESLTLLEEDDPLRAFLGDEFVEAYTVMRRYELQRFSDHITDWERSEYMELY